MVNTIFSPNREPDKDDENAANLSTRAQDDSAVSVESKAEKVPSAALKGAPTPTEAQRDAPQEVDTGTVEAKQGETSGENRKVEVPVTTDEKPEVTSLPEPPKKIILKETEFTLPEILQKPYPKAPYPELGDDGSKNAGDVVSVDEAKKYLAEARENNEKFDKLCSALLNEEGDEALLKFMYETAKAFLEENGEPKVTPPLPRGKLLHAKEHDWFIFIGDVHGSLHGLINICADIITTALKPENKDYRYKLIFLGDLIDRGEQSLETFTIALYLKSGQLGIHNLETIIIKGNHDEGLYLSDANKCFKSTITPAEVVDTLNQLPNKEYAETIGKAAIRLAQISPCMGEIMDIDPDNKKRTLLFCHGGVPHVDLQDELYQEEGLSRHAVPETINSEQDYISTLPEALRTKFAKDYTWIRLVDNMPRKKPNRGSSGCQMGTEDVNRYRKQHWQRTGRAISFIIRGHEHETTGFRLYSYDTTPWPACPRGKFVQKNCGVLTINAMEPNKNGGLMGKRRVVYAYFQGGDDKISFKVFNNELQKPAEQSEEPPSLPEPKEETPVNTEHPGEATTVKNLTEEIHLEAEPQSVNITLLYIEETFPKEEEAILFKRQIT